MTYPEKPKFITAEGERVFRQDMPEDIEEQAKIREEKDFIISKLMGTPEGTMAKIMEINDMPDEEFREKYLSKKKGEIVQFSIRKNRQEKAI
jgi:hypothetical protein